MKPGGQPEAQPSSTHDRRKKEQDESRKAFAKLGAAFSNQSSSSVALSSNASGQILQNPPSRNPSPKNSASENAVSERKSSPGNAVSTDINAPSKKATGTLVPSPVSVNLPNSKKQDTKASPPPPPPLSLTEYRDSLAPPNTLPAKAQPRLLQDQWAVDRVKFFLAIAHSNRDELQPDAAVVFSRKLNIDRKRIIQGETDAIGQPVKFLRTIKLSQIGMPGFKITVEQFQEWYKNGIIEGLEAIEVEAIIGNNISLTLSDIHLLLIGNDFNTVTKVKAIRTACKYPLISKPSELQGIDVDLTVNPQTYHALPGIISWWHQTTVRENVDEKRVTLRPRDQGYIPRRVSANHYDYEIDGNLQVSKIFPPHAEINEYHIKGVLFSLLQNIMRPPDFICAHINMTSESDVIRDGNKTTYFKSLEKHFNPGIFQWDIVSHMPEFTSYFQSQYNLRKKNQPCDLTNIIHRLMREGKKLKFNKDAIEPQILQRLEKIAKKLSFCLKSHPTPAALKQALDLLLQPIEFILHTAKGECKDANTLQNLTKVYVKRINTLRDEIIPNLPTFREYFIIQYEHYMLPKPLLVIDEKSPNSSRSIGNTGKRGGAIGEMITLLCDNAPFASQDGVGPESLLTKRLNRIKEACQPRSVSYEPVLREILTPHIFILHAARREAKGISVDEKTQQIIDETFMRVIVSLQEIILSMTEFQNYFFEQFQIFHNSRTGDIQKIAALLKEDAASLGISWEDCIQDIDAKLHTLLRLFPKNLNVMPLSLNTDDFAAAFPSIFGKLFNSIPAPSAMKNLQAPPGEQKADSAASSNQTVTVSQPSPSNQNLTNFFGQRDSNNASSALNSSNNVSPKTPLKGPFPP